MVDATQMAPQVRADRLPVFASVARSVRLFAAAPLPFLLYSVPLTVPNLLIAVSRGVRGTQTFGKWSIAAYIVHLLMLGLAQAAMTHAAVRLDEGAAPPVGESFGIGLRRYLPMIGLTILFLLAFYLGLLLLVVPGVMVFCAFAVAVPVCVAEAAGPIDSLRRSAVLTKGSRWRVLGIYALVFVPLMVISGFDMFVLLRAGHFVAFTIVNSLVSVFWVPLVTILVAVLYGELRRQKESFGVASVFD